MARGTARCRGSTGRESGPRFKSCCPALRANGARPRLRLRLAPHLGGGARCGRCDRHRYPPQDARGRAGKDRFPRADYPAFVKNIRCWPAPGGDFAFSVEHPVFTAYGTQDYGPNGEILHFPPDNHYYEGEREALFLGDKALKYHRPPATYINTLLEEGFAVRRGVEPQPPESMLGLPGMKVEMRRPMVLLVSARRD